jgi:hypothetical protein
LTNRSVTPDSFQQGAALADNRLTMKVLDLRCQHHHPFEGWFASEDDYQSQLAQGLLECPLCGDRSITRLPSAPRLNMMPRGSGTEAHSPARVGEGAHQAVTTVPPAPGGTTPPDTDRSAASQAVALKSIWMHAVQHVMANTDDVGDRFAEEARRMHYGEAEERAIRGQATVEDAEALREEGIEVMALRLPVAAKGSLQ